MPSWFPSRKYEAVIEPERISLGNDTVRVEVEPRVWVGEDGRILGLGARPPETSGRAIDVFGPATPAEAPRFEARFGALVQLFRHLIRATHNSALFALRPHVRVHGAASFRAVLGGREEQFVRDALIHAGASKVEFAT
ncbi:MAG: hypothetical protein M3303_02965 [Gemmatimonadota bacterium]|nr:hypothetical protein [Gemmatimonadota bacterium]